MADESKVKIPDEFLPRFQCRQFFIDYGLEEKPNLVDREFFDLLFNEGYFQRGEGPYKEKFGDGPGEPYNPRRQVFGIINDNGELVPVYCELARDMDQRVIAAMGKIGGVERAV